MAKEKIPTFSKKKLEKCRCVRNIYTFLFKSFTQGWLVIPNETKHRLSWDKSAGLGKLAKEYNIIIHCRSIPLINEEMYRAAYIIMLNTQCPNRGSKLIQDL